MIPFLEVTKIQMYFFYHPAIWKRRRLIKKVVSGYLNTMKLSIIFNEYVKIDNRIYIKDKKDLLLKKCLLLREKNEKAMGPSLA